MTNIVLYADSTLLAVDKPAGIATIPERDATVASLLGLLREEYGEGLLPVHRLDKEVSGVVLFARNPEVHRELNRQFEEREVRKVYVAIVHGVVPANRGRIEAPIRAYGSGRMGVDPRRGKPSETAYRVIERLPFHTLLEAYPLTGRRHQIRVHLYHLGYPIVGDRRYGTPSAQGAASRLFLHAADLTFQTPDGRRLIVSSPLPAVFETTLSALRFA